MTQMKSFVYENPIDRILYYSIEYISDYVYFLNITPNMITFLSLVTGLYSAYLIYQKKIYLAFFIWIISYYLDLLDGYIARKYDKGSVFGGWFDHISDMIKLLVIIYVLYIQEKYLIITILVSIFIVSLLNTSCRTKFLNRDSNPNDSLYILQKSCPDKNYVKYTRYIGDGTVSLLFPIIIILLYNK